MRLSCALPCLLLVLLAALPTSAQDATEQAADAETFVLEAIASFTALPGYHFAYEIQNVTTVIQDGEVYLTTVTLVSAEGDALADGDSFVTISLASSDSLEAAEATPPLHVERTIFQGKSALNFQLEDSVYEDLIPFEEGWQSYEDHATSVEGMSTQVVLDNFNNMQLPVAFFADESLIQSVTELEPEVVDGVDMRVFQVEIDALAFTLERTPAESRGDLESFFQNLELLAASELSASHRLWIGADDGQIYQGVIDYATDILYESSGFEEGPPYDLTTSTLTTFTIAAHGEAVDIEPVVFPD